MANSLSKAEKHRKYINEHDRLANLFTTDRFAMIQALLWHHVVNDWQPVLEDYVTTLNSFQRSRRNRPALSLVKKTTPQR